MQSTAEPLRVDLSPNENGDRIGVVTAGEISHQPAKRVNIGVTHTGAGGYCRYVRRARNGDLYVTGPNLESRMFRSADAGHSWESWTFAAPYFISAFTILHDDTFLTASMPNTDLQEMFLARSTDYGRTWQSERLDIDPSPHTHVSGWNADMIELRDGTVLLTLEMKNSKNGISDASGNQLPLVLRGVFTYLLRSRDGGRTWCDRHPIALHGAEAHLLEMPTGQLLAAIRKQRWFRQPGDPADIETAMRANGYNPEYTGFVEPIEETASFFKSVFIAESSDAGRTWVNERRISGYEQCSGELTLLADGKTLVLAYDSRYRDRFAEAGVRARVSYDAGGTWAPEEYVLGEGENYPGCIATPEGDMITVCPHRNMGQIQAVHWRPSPKPPQE